jgi:hypothetical protein
MSVSTYGSQSRVGILSLLGSVHFGKPTTAHTTINPVGIMSDARHGFDEGGNSNAIIPSPGQPSPGQKLLSSMVLGDGSFEASMKERSRVSSSISHIAYSINFN